MKEEEEDEDGELNSENEIELTEQQAEVEEEKGGREGEEHKVVKFLDSVDSYLTLFDSLSSTLRQGWLELASARHSMGASRINSALFDLKYHCAATSLQVAQDDVDSVMKQPIFTLCKWVSPDNRQCSTEKGKADKDDILKWKSTNPQLRYRGTSEIQEKMPESNGSIDSTLTVDNQIQKERSKSLSIFGALVSPKLRAAQLSFETALDTLVQIANMQSTMLSACDQVRKEMESNRD
ncbi:hypothetical protein U1Q18_015986 [Sarracenia purpurea var. burkii]